MSKVYYEKRGRRYYPVLEHDYSIMDALPLGHHLISVTPGVQSCKRNVDPDYAAMIAAGKIAEEAIAKALSDWFDCRTKTQQLTEHQYKLWSELKDSFERQEQFEVFRKSVIEIARQGVAAMQAEAEKLHSNPAAKEAWDHFQTIAALTKNVDNCKQG